MTHPDDDAEKVQVRLKFSIKKTEQALNAIADTRSRPLDPINKHRESKTPTKKARSILQRRKRYQAKLKRKLKVLKVKL